MKKTICFILTLLILISSVSFAWANKFNMQNLDLNGAIAYGEVLDDITTRIKDASSDNSYTLSFKSDMPFGISYAELIDFDASSIPELFVFYMYENKYIYEVWTLSEGNALRLYFDSFDMKSNAQNQERVFIAQRDDISEYIEVKNGIDGLEEQIKICSVINGEWKAIKVYQSSIVKVTQEDGSEADVARCIVRENGTETEISKQEYDALRGLYINDAIDELYNYNSQTGELYINKLKTDVNQAEKLSELASKINAFVNSMQNKATEEFSYSDVFSSLSVDEKSYLASLLTFFSGGDIGGNIDLANAYNAIVNHVAYKSAYNKTLDALKSSENEEQIMFDQNEVDFEVFKRLGFYPNENYYNGKSDGINIIKDGYYHLINISMDDLKYSFQPEKMYKINETTFMVPFSVYLWDESSPAYSDVDVNEYMSKWSESIQKSAVHDKSGYAIVEKTSYDEYPYFIKEMNVGGVYPVEEYLERYAYKIDDSYLKFNYNIKNENLEEFLSETERQLLSLDVEVSFDDMEKLADYIEFAIESSLSTTFRAKSNEIEINTVSAKEITDNVKKVTDAFDQVLSKSNVTLNKDTQKCAKVFFTNISENKPVKIKLTNNLLKLNADTIKIMLSSENYYVEISSEELKEILGSSKEVELEIVKSGNVYTILFLQDGKKIDKIDGKIKISLPCSNKKSSVFFFNDNFDSSYCGQYNHLTDGIEFYMSYPGEYEVENSEKTIHDIDVIAVDDREIIEFLVSKDIMELNDKNFNPHQKMTRKELAKAIVKMLYVQDFDLDVQIADIDDDDKYYTYIASAINNGLLKLYDDDEFKGESGISKEAIISVVSKILTEEKGYKAPLYNLSELYIDADMLSCWEGQEEEISLAAALGIINTGGILMPQADVTRLEGGKILYNLFNTLYKIPQATAVTNTNIISQYGPVIAIVALSLIVIAIIAAIVVAVVRKRKRRA